LQGRDLIDHLCSFAGGRPVICAGDFNAEPSEPVYATMTSSDQLRSVVYFLLSEAQP
jgi:nocturnin